MTNENKRRETIIKNYGSWEAYIQHMKKSGSKGGKNGGRPFKTVPGLASKAAKINNINRWKKDANNKNMQDLS